MSERNSSLDRTAVRSRSFLVMQRFEVRAVAMDRRGAASVEPHTEGEASSALGVVGDDVAQVVNPHDYALALEHVPFELVSRSLCKAHAHAATERRVVRQRCRHSWLGRGLVHRSLTGCDNAFRRDYGGPAEITEYRTLADALEAPRSAVTPTAHGSAAVTPDPLRTVSATGRGELSFAAFRDANVSRCLKWHPAGIESWSPSDWLTAVTGELGELASLLKMRNRERDGLPGNKFSPSQKQIADELADVLTYLDLLAAALSVDLGRATVEKFNEVSERVGFPDRIDLYAPSRST